MGICVAGIRFAMLSAMPRVRIYVVGLVPLLFLACRTVKPLPADDLSAPGWTVRQGQAVWKTHDSEIAGELIVAAHADGRSSLQFIKTPLPLVSAQRNGPLWTIRFVAEDRTVSGRGVPPAQLLWLHLAPALRGYLPPRTLEFKTERGGNWELRTGAGGESISGFLNP
jgi:hypothetical protein